MFAFLFYSKKNIFTIKKELAPEIKKAESNEAIPDIYLTQVQTEIYDEIPDTKICDESSVYQVPHLNYDELNVYEKLPPI